MGVRKSLKNFQKTSKICEFPSLEATGARKQGCKGHKALVNKGPREQRQTQNQVVTERYSSRSIQEEPLLTEGLSNRLCI